MSSQFPLQRVYLCMTRYRKNLLLLLVVSIIVFALVFEIVQKSNPLALLVVDTEKLMDGSLSVVRNPVLPPVQLTIEELSRLPPQYNLSDVREYHIYNRQLLRLHPSIRLTNTKHCRYKDRISIVKPFDPELPIIYVVTPTFTRWVQMAELIKNMCTAMKHVPNVLWILIEDSLNKTKSVTDFLIKCEIPTVHMNFKSYFKPENTVDERNAALQWIRENVDVKTGQGVLYFADDDNTYDPEIFEEMRSTKAVSVWPVGLLASFAEIPVVVDGKVKDWVVYFEVKDRKFPIDMSGFAINVKLLYNNTKVRFRHDIPHGHLETAFLESLDVPVEEFEPKADNCTKVLVWHTRTERYIPKNVNETKFGRPIPKHLGYMLVQV